MDKKSCLFARCKAYIHDKKSKKSNEGNTTNCVRLLDHGNVPLSGLCLFSPCASSLGEGEEAEKDQVHALEQMQEVEGKE